MKVTIELQNHEEITNTKFDDRACNLKCFINYSISRNNTANIEYWNSRHIRKFLNKWNIDQLHSEYNLLFQIYTAFFAINQETLINKEQSI